MPRHSLINSAASSRPASRGSGALEIFLDISSGTWSPGILLGSIAQSGPCGILTHALQDEFHAFHYPFPIHNFLPVENNRREPTCQGAGRGRGMSLKGRFPVKIARKGFSWRDRSPGVGRSRGRPPASWAGVPYPPSHRSSWRSDRKGSPRR